MENQKTAIPPPSKFNEFQWMAALSALVVLPGALGLAKVPLWAFLLSFPLGFLYSYYGVMPFIAVYNGLAPAHRSLAVRLGFMLVIFSIPLLVLLLIRWAFSV